MVCPHQNVTIAQSRKGWKTKVPPPSVDRLQADTRWDYSIILRTVRHDSKARDLDTDGGKTSKPREEGRSDRHSIQFKQPSSQLAATATESNNNVNNSNNDEEQ